MAEASGPPADGVLYTMGAARRMTGLTDRQIRYYHRRGLVDPRRSPGGHRLFTAEDLGRLGLVRSLLAQGLTVPEIGRRLGGRPDAAAPGRPGSTAPPGPGGGAPPPSPARGPG